MIALLVCGSRKWPDEAAVRARLDALESELAVVIEGGARGADRFAGRWAARARKRGVGWVRLPADWERYGKKAGPIRNQEMLDWLLLCRDLCGWEPRCLAFMTAQSIGTRDMVARCKAAGVHGTIVRA